MKRNQQLFFTGLTLLGLCCVATAVPAGTRSLLASASASSTAVSSSFSTQTVKSAIAKAFASAKAQGGNTYSFANAAAWEIGKAYAEAWAKVTGRVEVDGNGYATTTAKANAWAQAEIFARAIAEAVGEATQGTTYSGSLVRVEETKTAIAKAVANVKIQLTTRGGVAKATSEAVAKAIVKVTVRALADAVAFNVDSTSGTNVKGTAEVDTKGSKEQAKTSTQVETSGDSTADAQGNAESIARAYKNCWDGEAGPCCGQSSWHNGKQVLEDGWQRCVWDDWKRKWKYGIRWIAGIKTWYEFDNQKNACRCW